MTTKFCPDCGVEVPITEFAFKNKAAGIFQPYCNTHRKLRAKQAYQRNKTEVIAKTISRNKKYVEINKQWKDNLACASCGENSTCCLDFHHLDPTEKENTIGFLLNHTSLNGVLKEADKCIVVCRNCHAKIHAGEVTLTDDVITNSQQQMRNSLAGGLRQ